MIEVIGRIDGVCYICNDTATYFHYKKTFFGGARLRFLCNTHRLEVNKERDMRDRIEGH